MRYYQFHIGDYASHTRHLNHTEDLAYRRLLDFYYLHEQPIKQREIARQIGMRDCEQEVLSVLEEFFVSTDVGYINPRADREIEAYKAMKDAGKRGAEKRWGQDKSTTSDAPPIATPCPPHSHHNDTPIATINHEPLTINHKPKVVRGTRLDPLYPFPPEWSEFCKEKRPELVPREVFESFRDYWIAQPGQKGVKTDWDATWRNWVRSQKAPKANAVEERRNQMAELTRGLSVPKPKPFWSKQETTEVIPNVEPKRLL
jgi:uncharacterized protein YdaU (DUF1376 family)